ncbi:hypothetical protein GHT09_005844 [Marmota monax]|uniref:TIL domain-containing protein n=1 Tax=Marmota monax TaxID=9995 RepID=A0A834QRZ1_MARMO|nr:hypothetical protein GHT09_005844 [Marmota monax]
MCVCLPKNVPVPTGGASIPRVVLCFVHVRTGEAPSPTVAFCHLSTQLSLFGSRKCWLHGPETPSHCTHPHGHPALWGRTDLNPSIHPPHLSSLFPPVSCISGLITNCTSWPCEEAQGQPAWSPWTPWSVCSASCGPARRHRHRFCDRPSSVAPSTLALGPSPATPTPLCPGPEAEEEPCLLPGCDRECLPGAVANSSPATQDAPSLWTPPTTTGLQLPWFSAKPFPIPSSDVPQGQEAGGLGGPGPAVVGAVGAACAAGPEPVTNHHLKGWGTSVRGLRPREKPARLSRAQVPAREGVTDCTAIEGAQYSPCGPPCPRSCDDLVDARFQVHSLGSRQVLHVAFLPIPLPAFLNRAPRHERLETGGLSTTYGHTSLLPSSSSPSSLLPRVLPLSPPTPQALFSADQNPPLLSLQHCVWHCQPGCYCPPGQVLSADGTICVHPGHCSCLDLLTGERHRPGAQLARPDGCNHW